jgi:hypothetical protein
VRDPVELAACVAGDAAEYQARFGKPPAAVLLNRADWEAYGAPETLAGLPVQTTRFLRSGEAYLTDLPDLGLAPLGIEGDPL